MASPKILFPYAFSTADRAALSFVCQNFSYHPQTEITFMHLHAPPPRITATSQDVTGKLSSALHLLNREINRLESELKQVVDEMVRGGFDPEKLHMIFRPCSKDIAQEIADTAMSGPYNLVILSHRPDRAAKLFVRSVQNRVLSKLRGVPACVIN